MISSRVRKSPFLDCRETIEQQFTEFCVHIIHDEADGLDGPVHGKQIAQLRLGQGDIEVPDKNISHEAIVPLIFFNGYVKKYERNVKKAILAESPFAKSRVLERPHVFSLPALGAFGHVELHGLALLKALETARLNCREMDKNVFATLPANKAIAFGVVKPLHCALFCHVDTNFLSVNLRWRIRRYERQVLAVKARAAHDRFDLTLVSWYAGAKQLAMRFVANEAQHNAMACDGIVNDLHGEPVFSAIAYTKSA